jgi:hypothetical protein
VGPRRREPGVTRVRPTRSIRDAKRYLSFRSSCRAKRENPRSRKRRVNVICAPRPRITEESGQERPVLLCSGLAGVLIQNRGEGATPVTCPTHSFPATCVPYSRVLRHREDSEKLPMWNRTVAKVWERSLGFSCASRWAIWG